MPQKQWYAIWSFWLLLIVTSFAVLEGYALYTGGVTLSRYTWDLTLAWPLIPVVYGGIFIGLAVHFWWHWNPPGSVSQGFYGVVGAATMDPIHPADLPTPADVPGAVAMVAKIAARRVASGLGLWLIAHGALAFSNGSPEFAQFVEVFAGVLVWGGEVAIDWWRKKGMIMVSAQLAHIKNIPMPKAEPWVQILPSATSGAPMAVVVGSKAA